MNVKIKNLKGRVKGKEPVFSKEEKLVLLPAVQENVVLWLRAQEKFLF